MKKTVLMFIAGVFASCLLSACVTGRQHESWSEPEFAGRSLGKTVVMAIGESQFRINHFEGLFASQLKGYGVDAESIHVLYPKVGELTDDKIADLVQSNRFDSIFVTRVLSEEDRQQMVATGYRSEPADGYWGYGMTYTLNPEFAMVSNMMEYELETNLYEVKSKRLIWSVRTVVNDDKSDRANMQKVINRALRDLKKKKML